MPQSPIKVAIVGCNIGRAQAIAFQSLPGLFELRAVCDLDAKRAKETAAEFGVPFAFEDYAELCHRSDIDVISLCTPPTTHFRQIEMALAAGKHVISEKPVVGSLREIDELDALAQASGCRLMPIFQGRFGNGLQKLRHLVAANLTGRCFAGTVATAWNRGESYYSVPWRTSRAASLGGCLLQQGIHAHDAYCQVAGPPRRVFAFAATRVNPIETEDCAAVALEMEDGSVATFTVTLGAAVETTRHQFYFEKLTAESNNSAYTNTSDPWTFLARDPADQAAIDAALAGYEPGLEGYAGQFQRFHAALINGTELPVTVQDARASIELATALYQSIAQDRPVTLPITESSPGYAGWLEDRAESPSPRPELSSRR